MSDSFFDRLNLHTFILEIISCSWVELPTLWWGFFEGQDNGQEFSSITNHHSVRNAWQRVLYFVFDDNRRHIFSTRCDNQFFNPASNEQHTSFSHLSKISRVQVALLVESFRSFLCVLKVAHKGVATPVTDLPLLILWFLLEDFQFSPRNRRSYLIVVFRLLKNEGLCSCEVLRSTALGHSITVFEEEVETCKIAAHFRVQGSSSKPELDTFFQPQDLLDFLVNEHFGELELPSSWLASRLMESSLVAYTLRPSTDFSCKTSSVSRSLLHFFIYFFPNPRDTEEALRLDFLDCLHQCSGQSSRICKPNMIPIFNRGKYVSCQCSHVGQRQVADDSQRSWLFLQTVFTVGRDRRPSHVVMRKHHSFWHTCGSTGVQKSTTVSRLNLFPPFLKSTDVDICPKGQELLPGNQVRPKIMLSRFLHVQHNFFQLSLLQVVLIALGLLFILSHNDDCFRVLSNVLTRRLTVGRINADRDVPGKD